MPNSFDNGFMARFNEPITVSSISNNVVRGSFSGAFYRKDLNAGPGTPNEYVLVTEGAFNLPVR